LTEFTEYQFQIKASVILSLSKDQFRLPFSEWLN